MNMADKILRYKDLGFEFLIRKVDNYLCVTAYKDDFTTTFTSINSGDNSLDTALTNVFSVIDSYLRNDKKEKHG